MRSLLVALLVFGSLPLIVIKPHVGVLVWSWIGYMNPQTLTWGFAQNFPFALVVGVTTIAGWLLSREPKTLPCRPLLLLLAIFAAWVSFTTLFAAYPDQAPAKWDRTIKILPVSARTDHYGSAEATISDHPPFGRGTDRSRRARASNDRGRAEHRVRSSS